MDEEVSRFRAELRLRADRDMCRRFLIFGSCMQLDDESYYGLKAAVAEQFHIHPNEIIVVGSTKLGFSIAPMKRYRAFGETSDIDVAIISPQLFDHVWHEVLQYLDSARSWENRRQFSIILFVDGSALTNYRRARAFALLPSGSTSSGRCRIPVSLVTSKYPARCTTTGSS
jgi:hypothetical protein